MADRKTPDPPGTALQPPDHPRLPIRRFDVFADYNRVKNDAAGMPESKAKGDAVWLAKVVAGRRGGRVSPRATSDHGEAHEAVPTEKGGAEGFRSAGGVPQTDRTFDEDIVDRMGREFYYRVFHPAIEQAFRDGKSYEEIRDTIRKGWR